MEPTPTVVPIWIGGLLLLFILKHTVFLNTWGSVHLERHWPYWLSQLLWTVGVFWIGALVEKRKQTPPTS
jgi:hypothetical protein